MKNPCKVCDAADWFDPQVLEIIQGELNEIPRFHRKQWEFAMIFLALRKLGFLNGECVGLSMGAGKERLMYSIARHVRHLTVTDLYNPGTTWDCANTDDPDEFIRTDMPIRVDISKLKALRMDMRSLEFSDNTFDFCYSSCAIEHIGRKPEFLKHLNETYRVLRDGGVYVFTTEFHYGMELIEHPNNYIFPAEYLNRLISETDYLSEFTFDAYITRHKINYPVPHNMTNIAFSGPHLLSAGNFREFPHLQLLKGAFPFTSALLVLRKKGAGNGRKGINFDGLEAAREFMAAGSDEYRALLGVSEVTMNPYVFSTAKPPLSSGDHQEFCIDDRQRFLPDQAFFHTDYAWLASGEKTFTVSFRVRDIADGGRCKIELRVHRYKTIDSTEIESPIALDQEIDESGVYVREFNLSIEDQYCYAVLGYLREGNCRIESVSVSCGPAKSAPGIYTEADRHGKTTKRRWISKLFKSPGSGE